MAREMDFVDECYAGKDLSLLKKLTLIIPTHNRNYLSRCLWYHAHFPFGQIIVADSSHDEKKRENQKTVVNVQQMFGANILYLEYEPETEKYGGDIYRKWGDAVMHVDTEYSQICTDKEFVIPTTQIEAIQYLDNNNDYLIASGKYYLLNKYKNSIYFQKRYRKRDTEDSPNSIERYLSNLMECDNAHLLSLYNSKTLKYIYSMLLNNPALDLRFGERYLEYTGYLYGKAIYFPKQPFNIRDVTQLKTDGEMVNVDESSTLRYPQYSEYDKSSHEFKNMYDAFMQAISATVSFLETRQTMGDSINFTAQVSAKVLQDSYNSPNLIIKIMKFMNTYSPKLLDLRVRICYKERHVSEPLLVVSKVCLNFNNISNQYMIEY